jgi:hypothetical protein
LSFKKMWSLLMSWGWLIGIIIVGLKAVIGASGYSACPRKTDSINFALNICNEQLILPLLVSENLQLVL